MRNKTFLIAVLTVLAGALIAAGCGSDDSSDSSSAESTSATSTTTPTSVDEAVDQADEALKDAPANIDEAVQRCLDGVDESDISDEQKDQLKALCESGRDAAEGSVEGAQELLDQLGN